MFPGCKEVPVGSYGYVRANSLRSSCWKSRSGQLKLHEKCPFRDYSNSVRTSIVKLFDVPYNKNRIVISVRNVLNEWPHQARIKGQWFRRHGDTDVPTDFPVLAIQPGNLEIIQFSTVPDDSDILTGLPLIIDSNPMDRNFIIANSSDVAHSYDCHPSGLFGPRPLAWQDISNQWYLEFKKWLATPNLSDKDRTDEIDKIGRCCINTDKRLIQLIFTKTR